MKRACKNDAVSALLISSTTLGLQWGQATTTKCPVYAQERINGGYTSELYTFLFILIRRSRV